MGRRNQSVKRKCAKEAAKMIKDGMTTGFGGGSTVQYLIEEVALSGKKIRAVTPSMDTEEVCNKYHIPVLSLSHVGHIDIAFDGCDELDRDLNAIKSCGGIHTREKIVAEMAEQYILLADESKFFEQLQFGYPITVEVLPCARTFVREKLEQMGAIVNERHCANKTGLTVTDDGNYLMEAEFKSTSEIEMLNQQLNEIPGLVGHALFYQVGTGAIIAGADDIRILKKER